jgi:hypothetical protein
VQQIRTTGKKRRDKSGRLCVFSGLTYCADCGSKMILSSGARMKPEQDNFVCSGFRTKKQTCQSSHYIRRVVLEQMVLEQIQQVTAFATQHEREVTELLRRDGDLKSKKTLSASKRQLAQIQSRIVELDRIIQRLYEDNVSGKLTDERFVKLSRNYEQEQHDLQAQSKALTEQISAGEQQTQGIDRFLALVRKHTQVDELTATLLNELVERIEVHAPDRSSGKREQQVSIRYHYIGIVGKLELPNLDPSNSPLPNGERNPKAQAK